MSSSSNSSFDAAYSLGIIDTYILTALAALVAYEHVVTFDREVAVIWRRKVTGATVLFLLNRYCLLAYVILTIAPVYTKVSQPRLRGLTRLSSTSECVVSIVMEDVVESIQFTVFALFSALRVYAMWNCNIVLSAVVFLLDVYPVAGNIVEYVYSNVEFGIYPIVGPSCELTRKRGFTIELDFRLALAMRAAVIAANTLVLILTWAKTFRVQREAMRLNMRLPLSTLLLRDGTIYFLTLTTMSVINILVITVPSFVVVGPITWFFNIITGILVSRFILNLRRVDEVDEEDVEEGKYNSQFSLPGFRVATSAVTGNLGEPLDHATLPARCSEGNRDHRTL